jgi:hypothetical protein
MKEQRFEKIVEYEWDEEFELFFVIFYITILFVTLFTEIYSFDNLPKLTIITFTIIQTVGIGYISTAIYSIERKVYWRKI